MRAFRIVGIFVFLLLIVSLFLALIDISPAEPDDLGISIPLQKDFPTPSLYINPAVPSSLRIEASKANYRHDDDPRDATVTLDMVRKDEADSEWVYALVGPFSTLMDDVSSRELLDFWHGSDAGPFAGSPLRMAESTLEALTALWGKPAPGVVRTVFEDQLTDELWRSIPSWGIVPFEELEPRLKVLSLDGNSPIRNDFKQDAYPLIVHFRASDPSFVLPATNRDPSKMTTVMLTGVTALVRATAAKMERHGMTYPGEEIRPLLLSSDILHINNEVPFYSMCDVPDIKQKELVFCSRMKYMELLTYIDTDVVELTGDHFADYGDQAMLETLQVYEQAGIPYYGGGADLEQARNPLVMEHHGNKIAFIGCNDKYAYATAAETEPGAAPCDYDYMRARIMELRSQGYVVIATFQYEEYNHPQATEIQMQEFRWQADSGAQIVSGSQAHFAQVMEFYNGSFIHYGLGNLFFDQMGRNDGGIDNIRQQFVDEHVIYDGRHISTELHTFILMDYSQPRPMNEAERAKFLRYYFEQSGWRVPVQ